MEENTKKVFQAIDQAHATGGEVLELCNMRLEAIPGEVRNLKWLKKFYVTGNQLSYSPDLLAELSNL